MHAAGMARTYGAVDLFESLAMGHFAHEPAFDVGRWPGEVDGRYGGSRSASLRARDPASSPGRSPTDPLYERRERVVASNALRGPDLRTIDTFIERRNTGRNRHPWELAARKYMSLGCHGRRIIQRTRAHGNDRYLVISIPNPDDHAARRASV